MPTFAPLAVLITASSALMGLISLWAATSPRHWFVRVGDVFLETLFGEEINPTNATDEKDEEKNGASRLPPEEPNE